MIVFNKFSVIGLAALLAVVAIACSSGTSSTVSGNGGSGGPGNGDSGPVTAAMGQTVTLKSGDDVVDMTLSDPKQYSKDPKYGQKPQHGVYLTIAVTVQCKSGSHFGSTGEFKLVAADGTAYQADLGVGFDTLDFTELSAGQKKSGLIVFDVPKAAVTGAKIQVDGIGLDFDTPAAYWTV